MSFPIVALWSHPRSMSTAFERIMRARGDFACMHEPFMYEYYINRSTKQMPHFDAMEDVPKDYESIRGMILEKARSSPVFFKDMAYYVVPRILEDTAFMDRLTHSFLVRDPRASILSYAKLDPGLLREEVGLEAQWSIADALMKRSGKPPVVVRSEAVQADPEGELRKYWKALGLADKPHALQWTDAPPADWQQVQGWHQEVMASSTIRPITPEQQAKTEADFRALAAREPRFGEFLAHHLPYYTAFLRFAL